MVPQDQTPGNASLPQSITIAHGNATATVRSDLADALRDWLAAPVRNWSRFGLERIKERTVRSVFRGFLGGLGVHVKVFRAHKLSDRARDSLRGQRGRREAANLRKARLLGLPAVEPLAWGMANDEDGARSFVVTATLADARPFAFSAPDIAHARTGALLRRLHDLGALAGDLHTGNLLLDAEEHPHLIDLTSFRHGGEPDLARRAHDLALFCQELDGGPLDRRAARLLAAYRDTGRPLPPLFADQLELAARRRRAAELPAFGRRAFRPCRHTEIGVRRRGEARWFWHLANDGDALRSRCLALAASPPDPDKTGRRGAVWLTDHLVMKRRDRAQARRLWRAAYWLSFAGVDAAEPVALCLRPEAGLAITRRIANVSVAEELERGVLDPDQVVRASQSLGRSVGRLHAHGLRNRDLKFENLVRHADSDRVAMTDLDGVRRRAATDTRACGADLGRLLAAWRRAGAPGGTRTVRAFVRAWLRSHRDLLARPPLRRILRRAEQRAGEWAERHPAG